MNLSHALLGACQTINRTDAALLDGASQHVDRSTTRDRPGLYGYDIGKIWWEQPHAIIYQGQRKVDGLRVLIKLLRDPGSTEWGADWLQRDYRIAQGLRANCAVKPLAFEQTDLGPALIYADEGARPLEELAAKAPLDIETVLTIGASIAEAVARSAQGATYSLQPEPDHGLVE